MFLDFKVCIQRAEVVVYRSMTQFMFMGQYYTCKQGGQLHILSPLGLFVYYIEN